MKTIGRLTLHVLVLTAILLATAMGEPQANAKKNNNSFNWRNIQSDILGVGRHTDPNLVNPWGMAPSGTNLWVVDNGTGVATVYTADGSPSPNSTTPTVVIVPPGASNGGGANPTGILANPTAFFTVTKNAMTQPADLIFVAEDGSISGWNPTLDATHAILAVDNGASGAVYKGITGGVSNAQAFLYVANFYSGKVEMYNQTFGRADTSTTFTDPNLPAGFAPFNIRNINGQIYVTYAKQDANKEDDVPGAGNGFINVFDTAGNFVKRLISNDRLNSPWGLEGATATFGKFRNALFVGNFGDGAINIYDLTTGAFLGTPRGPLPDRAPIGFEGLWGLQFFNGALYVTAGIAGEQHGLLATVFIGK